MKHQIAHHINLQNEIELYRVTSEMGVTLYLYLYRIAKKNYSNKGLVVLMKGKRNGTQ